MSSMPASVTAVVCLSVRQRGRLITLAGGKEGKPHAGLTGREVLSLALNQTPERFRRRRMV
jgi:hypothetical protein